MSPTAANDNGTSQRMVGLITIAAEITMIVLQEFLCMNRRPGFLIIINDNRMLICLFGVDSHVTVGSGSPSILSYLNCRFIGMNYRTGAEIIRKVFIQKREILFCGKDHPL